MSDSKQLVGNDVLHSSSQASKDVRDLIRKTYLSKLKKALTEKNRLRTEKVPLTETESRSVMKATLKQVREDARLRFRRSIFSNTFRPKSRAGKTLTDKERDAQLDLAYQSARKKALAIDPSHALFSDSSELTAQLDELVNQNADVVFGEDERFNSKPPSFVNRILAQLMSVGFVYAATQAVDNIMGIDLSFPIALGIKSAATKGFKALLDFFDQRTEAKIQESILADVPIDLSGVNDILLSVVPELSQQIPTTTQGGDSPQQPTFTEQEAARMGIPFTGPTSTQQDEGGFTAAPQVSQEFNQGPSMAAIPEDPFEIQRALGKPIYTTGIGGSQALTPKLDEERKAIRGYYSLADRIEIQQTTDTPTARLNYLVPGSDDLVMSAAEQLRGDAEFDLFSTVKPGFGQGATNKLHLENEWHTKNIRYKGDLFTPNQYQGPELGVRPVRPSLTRVQTRAEQLKGFNVEANKAIAIEQYMRSLPGRASSGILPDDNNHINTATGRVRSGPSPLEPTINNHTAWFNDVYPAAAGMKRQRFRRLYDPMRRPKHRNPTVKDAGRRGMDRFHVTPASIALI